MSDEEALPVQFGRFKVLDVLGRGAMGVVYSAEDTALGRIVAIKTVALKGEPAERDQHEARFLQEARAAGGIAHPSIITIYDVGREGDMAFMAMELLEGRELKDLIREGAIRPSQAVAIAARVAEGLAHAHERGVIHRDIKPGNIMVLPDGRVKITDFGIARLREPAVKTKTGLLLGSPKYMSPEQVSGHGFDHRTDIFSLGVVLYEMLTGLQPFRGADLTELLFQVANMPVTPPTHLVPALPPVLDFIVARALKKNPEDRYASAAEFASDLRDCEAEVAAAQEAAAASAGSGTLPGTRTVPVAESSPPGFVPTDEQVELLPSTRFDSVDGLARLAVLPVDAEETKSRAGWTAPVSTKGVSLLRRVDWPFALVAVSYALAAAVAIFIVMR